MRVVTVSSRIGNVRSVVRALERATQNARSTSVVTTADPEAIRTADVLVLPGQGAFGTFAEALDEGLREVLVERIAAGVPYLGICLGLQILFEESDEAPGARGLGVLRGRVCRLVPGIDPTVGRPRPLPHIGWNRAEVRGGEDPVVASTHYYFAHSYAVVPTDANITAAVTTYGDASFASAIRTNRIVGVQFHPEKSQVAGLTLLERFFDFARKGSG
jgi:glutamine amidotransferase